jgi:hypothetical protein
MTRLLAVLAFALSACGPSNGRCDGEPWQGMLLDHYLRYPAMTLDDAIKLVQQATMGSEHAVTDRAAADQWLREELMTMGAGPMDQVVDTLGRGGRFARVHLRPWRARGGSNEALVAAFVAAANAPRDSAPLACALDALQRLADDYRLPWSPAEVQSAVTQWQEAGHPAIHHSERFRAEYVPAYRVVAVDDVEELLGGVP